MFRHGETDWNAQKRLQGSTRHIGLNDNGRRQARGLIDVLQAKKLDCIYTSPLRRAAETAEMAGRELGIQVYEVEDLRERSFGSFEGRTAKEIWGIDGGFRQFFTGGTVKWPDLLEHERAPETDTVMLDRFTAALKQIITEDDSSCIGISSHGAILYAFLSLVAPGEELLHNCEVLEFSFDDSIEGIDVIEAFTLVERIDPAAVPV